MNAMQSVKYMFGSSITPKSEGMRSHILLKENKAFFFLIIIRAL